MGDWRRGVNEEKKGDRQWQKFTFSNFSATCNNVYLSKNLAKGGWKSKKHPAPIHQANHTSTL